MFYVKQTINSVWECRDYFNKEHMYVYDMYEGEIDAVIIVADAYDFRFEQPDTDVIKASWTDNILR